MMAIKILAMFFVTSFFSILVFFACAQTSHDDTQSPDFVLVGSTPGDSVLAVALDISADVKIDFIRWELILHPRDIRSGDYDLSLHFGEGKPNTRGFMNDGFRKKYTGSYGIVDTTLRSLQGEVYSFRDDKGIELFSSIRLTDNLFHLLTTSGKLMVGNGGWSYSLHAKEPVVNNQLRFKHNRTISLFQDTTQHSTFDGRTACQEFIQGYGLQAVPDCIKLKWRIIFHRDSTTTDAGTYSMHKVRPIADPRSTLDHELTTLSGTWTQKHGIAGNPDIRFFQLIPENKGQLLNLMPGDENVLFFLDAKQQLLIGNEDFGFALNRKAQ